MLSKPMNGKVQAAWRTIAAVLSVVLLGVVVFLIVDQIHSNRLAIEKGCILTNNLVVRSNAELDRKGSPSAVLVRIILSRATPEEQGQFFTAVANDRKKGSPLIVPCRELAEHPEQIKAQPVLVRKPNPPTTSP